MLQGLCYKNNIVTYVDDVLIATTTREGNIEALQEVLNKILTTGILVNPSKAQLVSRRVTYPGVELGDAGRLPDTERVKRICKLSMPVDVGTLW